MVSEEWHTLLREGEELLHDNDVLQRRLELRDEGRAVDL
jgi:hypothetical protein